MNFFIVGVVLTLTIITTSAINRQSIKLRSAYDREDDTNPPIDGIIGLQGNGQSQQMTVDGMENLQGTKDGVIGVQGAGETQQFVRKETDDVIPPSAVIVNAEDTIKLLEGTGDVMPQCNTACTFLFRPVCGGLRGEHEETFANECLLKVRNCLNRTNWEVIRPGKCN